MAWIALKRRSFVTAEQRAFQRRLLANVRYELIPLKSARSQAQALPPGATVTVTASPAHGIDATLALAEWLQARQYQAVPHLSARLIRDRAHLRDVLQRARAAGITQAFVVGGDPTGAEGLRDGLTLLRAMHDIGHPFEAIGVPAYPEGHPSISDDELRRALEDKQPLAHSMTTQMSFDAAALASWLVATRAAGIRLPMYLGLPGAVELRKLMTIAARIGIAGTARYAAKNRRLIGALLFQRRYAPETLVGDLPPAMAAPEATITGLHLFTFNQVGETVAWTRRMSEQLG